MTVVGLSLPASLHALVIVNPEELQGIEQYRNWVKKAKGEVPMPKKIRIIEGTPCGSGGCSFPYREPHPAIALDYTPYLWENNDPIYRRDRRLERAIFYHELGHIWDLERGAKRSRNLGYRERFRSILELKEGRWLSRKGLFERFADAYSQCAAGSRRSNVYGYKLSHGEYRRWCRYLTSMI